MTGLAAHNEARTMLSRYISGRGLEMGPGHQPFPLRFPGASVRYVDRWEPAENAGLFPELGDDVSFPKPDIVSDLNIDGLSMVDDESEDFVIASHVLEHLSDPVAQLADIYRVLRPGGVTLILLPDRRRTFDQARQGTTLEHLLADHAAGMKVPDDAHLEEFLTNTEGWNAERDAATREATFERHRQRSIHVHCWTQHEFLPVLRYAITDMGMSWELIDALLVDDVSGGIEFGFVLRRALGTADAASLAERLDSVWEALEHSRVPLPPPPPPPAPLWLRVARRLPEPVRRPLRAVRDLW